MVQVWFIQACQMFRQMQSNCNKSAQVKRREKNKNGKKKNAIIIRSAATETITKCYFKPSKSVEKIKKRPLRFKFLHQSNNNYGNYLNGAKDIFRENRWLVLTTN